MVVCAPLVFVPGLRLPPTGRLVVVSVLLRVWAVGARGCDRIWWCILWAGWGEEGTSRSTGSDGPPLAGGGVGAAGGCARNSSSACHHGLEQQQRVLSRSETAAARAVTVWNSSSACHHGAGPLMLAPHHTAGRGQLGGALGGECPSPDPCTRAWVWISGVRPLSSNSSCVADAAKTPSPAPSSGGRGSSTVIRGC